MYWGTFFILFFKISFECENNFLQKGYSIIPPRIVYFFRQLSFLPKWNKIKLSFTPNRFSCKITIWDLRTTIIIIIVLCCLILWYSENYIFKHFTFPSSVWFNISDSLCRITNNFKSFHALATQMHILRTVLQIAS